MRAPRKGWLGCRMRSLSSWQLRTADAYSVGSRIGISSTIHVPRREATQRHAWQRTPAARARWSVAANAGSTPPKVRYARASGRCTTKQSAAPSPARTNEISRSRWRRPRSVAGSGKHATERRRVSCVHRRCPSRASRGSSRPSSTAGSVRSIRQPRKLASRSSPIASSSSWLASPELTATQRPR